MVKLIDRQVSGLPKISWARGKPTVIVAHETANPNSSVEGEIKYMANNYKSAFYHYIAGEDGFYMLHNPDIGGAWGAGPSMHNYAIHVELIRSSTKAGFNKAYNNYVEGIKYLADKYDIPLKVDKGTDKRGVYTHNYVTKTFGGTTHTDPVAYFKQYGKTINQFAKDLGASSGSVSKPSKPSKSANTATSVVDYLNAKGQDSSFSNRKKLASKHGISNYKGTASQNTELLNKLQSGSSGSSSKSSSSSSSSYRNISGNWTGQTLVKGVKGKPVRQLQTKLANNNPPFYPNKSAKNNGIDEYFGDDTEDATRRFQSYYGLTVDGKAGKEVYAKLGGKSSNKDSTSSSLPTGILKRGDRGKDVKQLQRVLNKANFKVGKVDGIYGAKTADAVRRFQEVYDAYNVDSIYGKRTRKRLQKLV